MDNERSAVISIQTAVNDHRREKREQEREKRDAEYHLERMKEYRK